jgi:hypothetical protein
MTKRFVFIGLFILLVSLVTPGDALAVVENPAEEGIARGGRLFHGTLTVIGVDKFSIQTRGGSTFTYQVDDKTRFRIKDVEDPSFTNLEIGMHLAVSARIIDGERIVRLVVVIPDDFDPSHRFGIRVRGKIIDISLDGDTLTIENPSGKALTFQVHKRTKYIGRVKNLDDLQTGWIAAIAGWRSDDGLLHAAIVVTTEPPRRVNLAGEVTSIEIEVGSFTLLTRQDQTVKIQVNHDTIINRKDGELTGLEDLQPGMFAAITGQRQDNGVVLAKRVIAGSKEDFPDFEIKKAGRIVVLGVDYLTLRTKSGEEITLRVNPDTHFRGRGIRVQGIADLKIGMKALVGGETGPDGEVVARVVFISKGFWQLP